MLFIIVFVTTTMWIGVLGHGRLLEPPSRTSMWRFGYNSPPDYDDNGHNCGGVGLQFGRNAGKCGLCGDPLYGSRDSEAGGIFAQGIITRTYKTGGIMDVLVQITANHKGYFEFHLCANNNAKKRITQACLDKHPLVLLNGDTRYYLTNYRSNSNFSLSLRLPPGLTCTQCVLQWKYTAGNTYNCNPILNKCCTGCGNQEQFYACADIAIAVNENGFHLVPPDFKIIPSHGLKTTAKEQRNNLQKLPLKSLWSRVDSKSMCQARPDLQPEKQFNRWCLEMCRPVDLFP